MSVAPETRQQLLELVYDLLPEPETAELRGRIASEPELARALAEVQAEAALLGEAARVVTPRVPLRRPEATTLAEGAEAAAPAAVKPGTRRRSPWGRGANWAVGLAASVLLLMSLVGYWCEREQLASIAAEHLRLVVTGPPAFHLGVPTEYRIATREVTGAAAPARVELALYAPDGKRLWGHKEKSDDAGQLAVIVPADLSLPAGARLEVLAVHRGQFERVDLPVVVEPIRYTTRLAVDKPVYQPGATMYYRSLSLSSFALQADRPMPIRFEILDPGGNVLAGSAREGVTDRGVGNGFFVIPADLPGGRYALAVHSLDNAFSPQQCPFAVRRYQPPRLNKQLRFARDSFAPGEQVTAGFLAKRAEGGAAAGAKLEIVATVDGEQLLAKAATADAAGAVQIQFALPPKIERGEGQLLVTVRDGGVSETIARTIPIQLGRLEVAFYPEGGPLVADLENRVYFVARNPLGKPVHVRGVLLDAAGAELATAETTHAGMGTFSFRPSAGGQYRLKITSPATKQEPRLPEVSSESKVVLTTGTGVFEPGEPLEFNLRAAKANLPLVVAATCRGVMVGTQALVTSTQNRGENAVSIPLGPAVGGVIRLTVFDYGASPPRPLCERLVYRKAAQRLDVRITAGPQRRLPGEKIDLTLQVSNEKGEPVPAVLGVAVVDDAVLSLADDRTPSLAAHYLLMSALDRPEELEEADFYLSGGVEARAALDLLLGTQGWRRFVHQTLDELKQEGGDRTPAQAVALRSQGSLPTVFDNLKQIRDNYDQSLLSYRAQRPRWLGTLTTASFFGGLALVLLVAMMGLLRIVSGLHLWVPAVGVTVCSLILGAILMDPSRLSPDRDNAVAFLPFQPMPPDVGEPPAQEEPPAPAPPAARRAVAGKPAAAEKNRAKDEAPGPAERQRQAGPASEAMAAAPEKQAVGAAMPPPAAPGAPGAMRKAANAMDRTGTGPPAGAGGAFGAGGAGRPAGAGSPAKPALQELAARARSLRSEELRFGRPQGEPADEALAKGLAGYRFPVRQYAHRHRPGPPGVRTDFSETLCWHPLLLADKDGRAKISFDLSDAVTTFRVLADAHGGGRIGSGRTAIVSQLPFSLAPTLPPELTAGDRIEVPVAVLYDSTAKGPVDLRLEPGGLFTLAGPGLRNFELIAGGHACEYFPLEVTGPKGEGRLTFRGSTGPLRDAVQRSVQVLPAGFPKNLSFSGQLDGPQQLVVPLGECCVPGSLEVTLSIFPSRAGELQPAKPPRGPASEGMFTVKRNGQVIARRPLIAGQQETIALDGWEAIVQPGIDKLTLTLGGENKVPYLVEVAYRERQPADDPACPLRLTTELAATKVTSGKSVALRAELVNTTDQSQPMAVAVLGLPAGLELRADQLEELQRAGTFDYYEIRPRELTCYWRSLGPSQTVRIQLDLLAGLPGQYVAPASRAYLQGTPEQKRWSEPLGVEITQE